jgi:hypothetical protein
VSFFGIDSLARINYIRQAPEHVVKHMDGLGWATDVARSVAVPLVAAGVSVLPGLIGG